MFVYFLADHSHVQRSSSKVFRIQCFDSTSCRRRWHRRLHRRFHCHHFHHHCISLSLLPPPSYPNHHRERAGMATYLQNGSCVVISGLTPSLFSTRSGDVYFVAVLDIPSQPARQVLYATLCSLRRVSCAVLMALVSSCPRTCLARGASSLPRNLMKFGDMLRCYPSSSECIVSTPKLLWFAMTIYSFWCLWLRNIQKIISVFVNRTGRICIRVHDEVVRCSRRVKDPWEAMSILADIMSHMPYGIHVLAEFCKIFQNRIPLALSLSLRT